ncbi:acyltransferase [Sphingomonas sanguinis]|uniref:acyltransferase family protein n=1 Tax=Sphingomonas sanguinis TaxID=33051 RepID=UPI001C59A4F8|nr:acyltransferase family protein [Sphingomonas sanguinis]QXT35546.1 acyltransferase [Sphingomonas sanguinis]
MSLRKWGSGATLAAASHGDHGAAVRHARGFRADIEGLRALAVVPILFNHVRVHGFLGGFIGVDIFFVISGYLITGILVRDMAAGRYSIAGFYRRRVLRIFPALFALLVVVSVLSFIALTPTELAAYGQSLAATILFASNIQFYGDTGYFTAVAGSRPLLHTWSLAVEEQFYLVWPLLIAWLMRRRAGLVPVIAALILLSFAASVWMVATDMPAAFYLIPFRFWELAAGGLLAVGTTPAALRSIPPRAARIGREALGLAGLIAILWCIRFFKEPLDFPGLNALPAVLGTVAIIATGPDTLVGRLLALRPVRWIGLISYSLYLWHWPVIVFAKLWLFLPQTAVTKTGQIGVSLVLAVLSYHLFEVRLRRPLEGLSTRRVLMGAGIVMAIGLTFAGVLIAGRGFPDRFEPRRAALGQVLDRDEEAAYRRGSCFVLDGGRFDDRTCLARRAPGPTILLVGDSVAAHLWPGFAADAGGFDIRQATMIGCTPKLFPDMPWLLCSRFFGDLLTRWAPAHHPAAVMLAGNWHDKDVAMIRRTMVAERARGQRVIVIGPMPRYTSALPRLLFFDPSGDRARASLEEGLWSLDDAMGAAVQDGGGTYISPLRLLCPDRRCRVVTRQGVPMQFDNVHLTREGSVEAVAAMMPAIRAAMRQEPAS